VWQRVDPLTAGAEAGHSHLAHRGHRSAIRGRLASLPCALGIRPTHTTRPMSFWRQVFCGFPREHWGKCANSVTSALDPLKTNVCSHTVGVMVSSPSPTSRSGRRLGIRRGGRSRVVRALVRRLIARAMALGRPGLGSQTRELAEGVPPGGSSVPSKARPTLADMDLTRHLTGLPAPTAGAPRAGFVRCLRARLTGSSRGTPRWFSAGSSRGFLARAPRARL